MLFLPLVIFLTLFQPVLFARAGTPDSAVVIALSQRPSTLDPRFAVDAGGMRLGQLIFQPILRLDKNLKIIPGAAYKWTYNNLIYTFYLKKNITFSNGRKIEKQDIEFSFEQFSSPKSPFYSSFKNIEKVHIQDTAQEFIVKAELKNFLAPFLSSDLTLLKLLPKKEILEDEKKWQAQPIGSGPFKLLEQNENSIHLQRRAVQQSAQKKILNTSFSGKDTTKASDVIFKIIRDDLTRFQKILKKEIDIVQSDLPYSKIEAVQKRSLPYRVIQKPGLSMNYILINFKDPLFKNKKARQALAFGVNTPNIIQHKLKSAGRPAASILHPENPFFNKALSPLVYDFFKAKQIMIDQGFTGKTISIKTSNNREAISHSKIIAQDLRQIGFKVRLKSYEWGAFYGDIKNGRFQLALLRWVGAFDPDIYRTAFHSAERPPQGRNRGFYVNKKLDSLLEKGRKTKNTLNRKLIYQQVQQIIAEDLAIIPLWHNQQTALVKNNIEGYFLPLNGSYDFLIPTSP